jgi:hypothetical protein
MRLDDDESNPSEYELAADISHTRGIYILNTAIMSSGCKPLVMLGKRCATCVLMGELMLSH